MAEYPRGSEWRRWDLQIHSPLSILNNGFPRQAGTGDPDWEPYLSKLEAVKPAVVGVTDYFTIDGYKALRTFQANGRLEGITLLPNVEFRLDRFISARSDGQNPRRLNFHVIFSDEVSPADIENHFLHDLNFYYENTPGDRGTRLPLKPENLKLLGTRLIAEDEAFRRFTPVQVGAMTAVVSPDEILGRLTEDPRFKGRYLVLLPAENWDQIPWGGQDHNTRRLLLQGAHLVLASNPNTIAWCLGKPPPYADGPVQFIREFGALKACVWGSDAHALDFVGHPCVKRGAEGHACAGDSPDCELRYCWIKADPTFEGLKQLLYEPEDRVRIQELDPTPRKSIFTIGRAQMLHTVINDELAMAGTDLPLNANLVAVTGSKGGGKTALVDMLAHCFMDREHTKDKNSFVRRIAGDAPALPIQIEFADGKRFEKTLADGAFFEDTDVAYIAQGELERYIDEHSDLNEYIHSLIFESPLIRDTLTAFEYESQTATVEALQRDLDTKNAVIIELEAATAPKVTSDIEKKGKQTNAELSDVTKRLQQLERQLSKENIEANTKRQERVTGLKAVKDQLSAARDLVLTARRAIDSDLARLAEVVTQLNAAITRLELGPPLAVPAYPDVGRLDEVKTAIQDKLRGVVKDIEAEEKKIQATTAELREHTQLLRRKKELESQVSALREQWKQIQEKKGRLNTERSARMELLTTLLNAVVDQQARYRDVIAAFGTERENILSDLAFEAIVSVDADGLMEALESLVDNRQVVVKDADGAPVACATLVELLQRLASGESAVIPEIGTEADRLRADLRSKLKKAVGTQALDQALYQSHLTVRPVARYKNTSLDRLSLGQKATVLIKIYLAAGDKPIIIDSHDDHLDNEYIMDELVGAIRQAKEHRQVIIASNNGNVVLNSDAEQVIVAQRRDGVISYLAGALEEPEVREIALRVLEGGPEAFRRRQEKYRMSDARL